MHERKRYEFPEFQNRESLETMMYAANVKREEEIRKKQEKKRADERKLQQEKQKREMELLKKAVAEVAGNMEKKKAEDADIGADVQQSTTGEIFQGVVKRASSERRERGIEIRRMNREEQLGSMLQKWFPDLRALTLDEVEWKMLDYLEGKGGEADE